MTGPSDHLHDRDDCQARHDSPYRDVPSFRCAPTCDCLCHQGEALNALEALARRAYAASEAREALKVTHEEFELLQTTLRDEVAVNPGLRDLWREALARHHTSPFDLFLPPESRHFCGLPVEIVSRTDP